MAAKISLSRKFLYVEDAAPSIVFDYLKIVNVSEKYFGMLKGVEFERLGSGEKNAWHYANNIKMHVRILSFWKGMK